MHSIQHSNRTNADRNCNKLSILPLNIQPIKIFLPQFIFFNKFSKSTKKHSSTDRSTEGETEATPVTGRLDNQARVLLAIFCH